jgi:hypothetical protein
MDAEMMDVKKFTGGAFAGWFVDDVKALLENGLTGEGERKVSLSPRQLDLLVLYWSMEAQK